MNIEQIKSKTLVVTLITKFYYDGFLFKITNRCTYHGKFSKTELTNLKKCDIKFMRKQANDYLKGVNTRPRKKVFRIYIRFKDRDHALSE